MTPERRQRVREILDAVLQRDPSQRADFLSGVCGADDALRREIESLIAAREKDGSPRTTLPLN